MCSIRQPVTLNVTSQFPRRLSLVVDEPAKASRTHWQIVSDGPFTSDDPPLDYSICCSYNKAILMSNQAVAEAFAKDEFKYDYFSWDPSLPIDSVVLTMTFPPGIAVKFFPGVFFGQTEWMFNHRELDRIRSGFSSDSHHAVFSIHRPSPRFRYFIYWTYVE